MKLFLSDLHIGLADEPHFNKASLWILRNKPERIVLHGDTFHLNEVPWDIITKTRDFDLLLEIADYIPVWLIPGNHDEGIITYEVGGIKIVPPYVDDYGYQHSHWDEYDPMCKLPSPWHKFWGWLMGAQTPRLLKADLSNPAYILACQVIHTAILKERLFSGYIGGHTHFPMCWLCNDLNIELWNCGDMVDSFTGIKEEEGRLSFVRF